MLKTGLRFFVIKRKKQNTVAGKSKMKGRKEEKEGRKSSGKLRKSDYRGYSLIKRRASRRHSSKGNSPFIQWIVMPRRSIPRNQVI